MVEALDGGQDGGHGGGSGHGVAGHPAAAGLFVADVAEVEDIVGLRSQGVDDQGGGIDGDGVGSGGVELVAGHGGACDDEAVVVSLLAVDVAILPGEGHGATGGDSGHDVLGEAASLGDAEADLVAPLGEGGVADAVGGYIYIVLFADGEAGGGVGGGVGVDVDGGGGVKGGHGDRRDEELVATEVVGVGTLPADDGGAVDVGHGGHVLDNGAGIQSTAVTEGHVGNGLVATFGRRGIRRVGLSVVVVIHYTLIAIGHYSLVRFRADIAAGGIEEDNQEVRGAVVVVRGVEGDVHLAHGGDESAIVDQSSGGRVEGLHVGGAGELGLGGGLQPHLDAACSVARGGAVVAHALQLAGDTNLLGSEDGLAECIFVVEMAGEVSRRAGGAVGDVLAEGELVGGGSGRDPRGTFADGAEVEVVLGAALEACGEVALLTFDNGDVGAFLVEGCESLGVEGGGADDDQEAVNIGVVPGEGGGDTCRSDGEVGGSGAHDGGAEGGTHGVDLAVVGAVDTNGDGVGGEGLQGVDGERGRLIGGEVGQGVVGAADDDHVVGSSLVLGIRPADGGVVIVGHGGGQVGDREAGGGDEAEALHNGAVLVGRRIFEGDILDTGGQVGRIGLAAVVAAGESVAPGEGGVIVVGGGVAEIDRVAGTVRAIHNLNNGGVGGIDLGRHGILDYLPRRRRRAVAGELQTCHTALGGNLELVVCYGDTVVEGPASGQSRHGGEVDGEGQVYRGAGRGGGNNSGVAGVAFGADGVDADGIGGAGAETFEGDGGGVAGDFGLDDGGARDSFTYIFKRSRIQGFPADADGGAGDFAFGERDGEAGWGDHSETFHNGTVGVVAFILESDVLHTGRHVGNVSLKAVAAAGESRTPCEGGNVVGGGRVAEIDFVAATIRSIIDFDARGIGSVDFSRDGVLRRGDTTGAVAGELQTSQTALRGDLHIVARRGATVVDGPAGGQTRHAREVDRIGQGGNSAGGSHVNGGANAGVGLGAQAPHGEFVCGAGSKIVKDNAIVGAVNIDGDGIFAINRLGDIFVGIVGGVPADGDSVVLHLASREVRHRQTGGREGDIVDKDIGTVIVFSLAGADGDASAFGSAGEGEVMLGVGAAREDRGVGSHEGGCVGRVGEVAHGDFAVGAGAAGAAAAEPEAEHYGAQRLIDGRERHNLDLLGIAVGVAAGERADAEGAGAAVGIGGVAGVLLDVDAGAGVGPALGGGVDGHTFEVFGEGQGLGCAVGADDEGGGVAEDAEAVVGDDLDGVVGRGFEAREGVDEGGGGEDVGAVANLLAVGVEETDAVELGGAVDVVGPGDGDGLGGASRGDEAGHGLAGDNAVDADVVQMDGDSVAVTRRVGGIECEAYVALADVVGEVVLASSVASANGGHGAVAVGGAPGGELCPAAVADAGEDHDGLAAVDGGGGAGAILHREGEVEGELGALEEGEVQSRGDGPHVASL